MELWLQVADIQGYRRHRLARCQFHQLGDTGATFGEDRADTVGAQGQSFDRCAAIYDWD